ncbi:hypothetical protein FKP32DRAFT_1679415 [Trametes sanguinea]|nr:hypothetical protein FKP32DRAFT_1679415 [Trametes sanguinea]
MSELGFNISGLITGIIGVAAVIPPLAYWFYYYLPTPKLREVEQRLKEAEVHFEDVLKSGLLTEFRVDDARVEVYNIRSKSDELACWWKGLSSDMAVIFKKSSCRERRALAAAGYTAQLASWTASREHLVHPVPGSPWSPSLSVLHTPPAYVQSNTPAAASRTFPGTTPVVLDGPQPPPLHDHTWPPTPFSQSTEASTPLTASFTPTTPKEVKQHTVSDDDLRHLLSLALARPSPRDTDGGRRQRVARQAVLKRFGKQLSGGHVGHRNAVPPKLGAVHGRFKEAKHLLSHAGSGGMLKQSVVDLPNYLHLDPESLTPQRAGGDDCDDAALPEA